MKGRPQPEAGTKVALVQRPGGRTVTFATRRGPTGQLEKVLSLIKTHPGIRPSELNRLLNVEQSDGLRSTLIKRGLIRKERDGSAMRYYVVWAVAKETHSNGVRT